VAQVLKADMRDRITAAALRLFAERGYAGTSMTQLAAEAGMAPGNLYRYFPSKEALFAAVVPHDLAERHDRLLDTRVAALAEKTADRGVAADELLEFWLEHRPEIVILLDKAEGTPFAAYPATFVQRLVRHVERSLQDPPSPAQRRLLELVFDNTRRALAHILQTAPDGVEARTMVEAFWSYQLPGLEGLLAHFRTAPA
jgi:AcrR family transcriptional regulator